MVFKSVDYGQLWSIYQIDLSVIEKANVYHLTIKFTAEVSEIETTFLDTTVYKGERFEKERILELRTYFQSLLKHFCLHTSTAITQPALKRFCQRRISQASQNKIFKSYV